MKVTVIEEQTWKAIGKRVEQLRDRYDHELEKVRRERLFSSEEVAAMLKITPGTLATYRCRGKIGFIKVGKRCLYRWKDIEPFIATRMIKVA